jgi:hypothetical protein
MGTDIHPLVQVRVDDRWVNHEWPDGSTRYRWDLTEESPLASRAFMGLNARNYSLFAILAGVRNGFGFAGTRWGEPVEPIAPERGLPEDYSHVDVYGDDDELENWLGDHSYTWMTLKEVLDWPGWNSPMKKCGMVKKDVERDAVGRPTEWCGGVSGQGAEDYEFEEWQSDPKDVVGWFWSATVPYLKSLADDPKDVRIVMGFDS